MRLSVIGCGYLGAVHAASMAKLGHEVVGIDIDQNRIDTLSAGQAPFYEPGLPEVLNEALASGRLRFSTDMASARDADVHFLCVGTPQKAGEYAADLTYVDSAIDALIPYLGEGALVVGKSTVPVGTAARLDIAIREAQPSAMLAWNPEFLREGFAVKDTLHPDRLVYGLPVGYAHTIAKAMLDEVYAATIKDGTPVVQTDFVTAELVKVAANSFLATKISFINAMAELCEITGGDVTQLADAIGHDKRIGRRFLNAGVGFGGGCLPKDIRAFMARAAELGASEPLSFLREVDAINERRRHRMVELTIEECGGSIRGKRIAVLGAAFKPDSDDVRNSPALDIAAALQAGGATVIVTDPQALDNAARVQPTLTYAKPIYEAVLNADAVLLLTEWSEYRELDPDSLAQLVRNRCILDGRNVLDPAVWRAAGWSYRALGRASANGALSLATV
ncbi:UDPglucose 6-dehydrogenase [Antricoccus suffuscus]|uniref:UDP-glucose 6-dehydrogenase n=2 Tax=Antricoccus suffuscus TaxID=1629062 RepID=A0A2T1A1N7_9ACTN|nr:UDP-glucose/GDP-mannose dehydrogenase family protein [Antricoccus suffuscus]PRZ42512.1 UDPglucose 6-dehydrogenase [Antricoccus suffuscus]